MNENLDANMFGFVVSLIGMAVCVVGAGIWSCWS